MKTIYVFLAEGFEEVEALTPVDVLRRAGLPVKTVSITGVLTVNGAHGVPVVMMGNVICQSVTGEETTPCSTSAGAVNYMRTTMGFNGLLITDDLSDASLNKVCTQDEAAVAAVKAGMSMLYVSTGFESSYNAVLSAVNSGEIPAEKLDDAVGRILTTKGI